jgi:hypothetical protein
MSSVTSVITYESIPKLVLDDLVFTDITKITDISEITEEYLINLIAEHEEWSENYLIDLYWKNYLIDFNELS